MALFKDDKDEKSNSMSDFLFSKDNKNNNAPKKNSKSSTLMFGGDYSNNKTSSIQNNSNNGHKKVPMFNDSNDKNNNTNKNKNTLPTFDFSHMDIKPYNVVNDEHKKKLDEIKELVDYYSKKNVFSEEDKTKIYFLIEELKREV